MVSTFASPEALMVSLGSYLLGCVTSGFYLVRWRTGLDLRRLGSGNLGARNVCRVLGIPGLVATLLFDVTKGFLAVWLAGWLPLTAPYKSLALLCVVIGHVWPMQLKGKGGKGVAPLLGALLAYDFQLALCFVVCFLAGYALIGRFMTGAMLAFLLLPAIGLYLEQNNFSLWCMTIVSAVVVIGHRKNLARDLTEWIKPETQRKSQKSQL